MIDDAIAMLADMHMRIDLECNAYIDIIHANRPANKDTNRDVPAKV